IINTPSGVTIQRPSGNAPPSQESSATPIPAERTIPGTPPPPGTGTGTGPSGQPGTVPGSAGPNPSRRPGSEEHPVDVSGFPVYQNDDLGLQVPYAPNLVVVEPTPPLGATPAPSARIWFVDSSIANSQLAGLAPPELAIDIFDNPDQAHLEAW